MADTTSTEPTVRERVHAAALAHPTLSGRELHRQVLRDMKESTVESYRKELIEAGTLAPLRSGSNGNGGMRVGRRKGLPRDQMLKTAQALHALRHMIGHSVAVDCTECARTREMLRGYGEFGEPDSVARMLDEAVVLRAKASTLLEALDLRVGVDRARTIHMAAQALRRAVKDGSQLRDLAQSELERIARSLGQPPPEKSDGAVVPVVPPAGASADVASPASPAASRDLAMMRAEIAKLRDDRDDWKARALDETGARVAAADRVQALERELARAKASAPPAPAATDAGLRNELLRVTKQRDDAQMHARKARAELRALVEPMIGRLYEALALDEQQQTEKKNG